MLNCKNIIFNFMFTPSNSEDTLSPCIALSLVIKQPIKGKTKIFQNPDKLELLLSKKRYTNN